MTTNQDRQSVRELLDACRAHSDDLQLPELNALAAAIQSDPELELRLKKGHQIDDLIGGSLREVPIPDGLESRLIATLASGEPRTEMLDPELDEELDAVAGTPVTSIPATSVPLAASTPRSRRWRTWSLVSVAAAVTLIAVCWSVLSKKPTLATPTDVALHTGEWLSQLADDQWSTKASPGSHPMPGQLAVNGFPWQMVPKTGSSFSVLCYDVSSTNSKKQYFFVCSTSHSVMLPKSPPRNPIAITFKSAQWSVGGWTSAEPGFVYALAIEGDEKQYRYFIGADSNIASVRHRRTRSG